MLLLIVTALLFCLSTIRGAYQNCDPTAFEQKTKKGAGRRSKARHNEVPRDTVKRGKCYINTRVSNVAQTEGWWI